MHSRTRHANQVSDTHTHTGNRTITPKTRPRWRPPIVVPRATTTAGQKRKLSAPAMATAATAAGLRRLLAEFDRDEASSSEDSESDSDSGDGVSDGGSDSSSSEEERAEAPPPAKKPKVEAPAAAKVARATTIRGCRGGRHEEELQGPGRALEEACGQSGRHDRSAAGRSLHPTALSRLLLPVRRMQDRTAHASRRVGVQGVSLPAALDPRVDSSVSLKTYTHSRPRGATHWRSPREQWLRARVRFERAT